jgi:hypothetical protein
MCRRHASCIGDVTHVQETCLMYRRHDACVGDMPHIWALRPIYHIYIKAYISGMYIYIKILRPIYPDIYIY